MTRGRPTSLKHIALLFFKLGARVDQLIGNLPKAQVRSKVESLLG